MLPWTASRLVCSLIFWLIRQMGGTVKPLLLGTLAALTLLAPPVFADEVKVGITASITGPFSVWGKEYREGIDLFRAQNGTSVNGHDVNVLYRDVGGAN